MSILLSSVDLKNKKLYTIIPAMSIFEGPPRDGGLFLSRFLRVCSEIHVVESQGKSSHHELAVKDNILTQIDKLRDEDPIEVDGGFLMARDELIIVSGDSFGLELPLTSKARERTVTILTEIFPDSTISSS